MNANRTIHLPATTQACPEESLIILQRAIPTIRQIVGGRVYIMITYWLRLNDFIELSKMFDVGQDLNHSKCTKSLSTKARALFTALSMRRLRSLAQIESFPRMEVIDEACGNCREGIIIQGQGYDALCPLSLHLRRNAMFAHRCRKRLAYLQTRLKKASMPYKRSKTSKPYGVHVSESNLT